MRQCESRIYGLYNYFERVAVCRWDSLSICDLRRKELLKVAIEVEEDAVIIPVDFSTVIDKEVSIRAFQDLDEDKRLKFDRYGRPAEPCLQTTLVPQKDKNNYELKLQIYNIH